MADRNDFPDQPTRCVPFLTVGIRHDGEVTRSDVEAAQAMLADASGMIDSRVAAVKADAPAAGDDIKATIELNKGTGINSRQFNRDLYRREFEKDPNMEVTGIFVSSGDPDADLQTSQRGGGL